MIYTSVESNQSFPFEFNDHAFIEPSSSIYRHHQSFVGLIVTINKYTLQSTYGMSNQQLIENQSPVEFVSTTLATDDDEVYASVRIPDHLWTQRLQDKGCTKDKMPAKVYQRAKIPPFGPKGDEIYYYGLTSIAIDIIANMKLENDLGLGWSKVPKNRTDAKVKLVQVILSVRKLQNDEYHLDQSMVLDMCSNMWGAARPANTIHHNDRVRVFGVIMTLPENRDLYGRIANGPNARNQIDSVEYHPKQIFQSIALGFNNEDIVIELPPDAYDLHSIDQIDPNDIGRIRITRDCKLLIYRLQIIVLF